MRLQRTLLALSLLVSSSALAQNTTTDLVTVSMTSGSSSFNRAKCLTDSLSVSYQVSSTFLNVTYTNVKFQVFVTASSSCPTTKGDNDHWLKSETTLTGANLTDSLTFSPKTLLLEDQCLPNVNKAFQVCAIVKYTIPATYIGGQSTDDQESDSLTITYDSKLPAAPTITEVTAGDSRLVVDWTAQDDIESWTLYYRKAGADAGVGDAGEGGGTGAGCTPSCSGATPECSSEGKCLCTTNSCDSGSSCINGSCVVNSCSPTCSGEKPDCYGTTCKCNDKSCPTGKTCTNGECVAPTCNPACSGETPDCKGTVCQCNPTSCGSGKSCIDGVCAETSFDPTGWTSGAVLTGSATTTGEVRNLENDQPYEVMVVATDKAGNVSPAGVSKTETPLRVDDFFRRYRGRGGDEMGGFGCSSAGMVAVPAVAISILALLRRRRGA